MVMVQIGAIIHEQINSFEIKTDLPIKQFDDLANKLLGFESRYARIKQVQLLLQVDELEALEQTEAW